MRINHTLNLLRIVTDKFDFTTTYDKIRYYMPKCRLRYFRVFDEFVSVFECQIHMLMCMAPIPTIHPILKLRFKTHVNRLF